MKRIESFGAPLSGISGRSTIRVNHARHDQRIETVTTAAGSPGRTVGDLMGAVREATAETKPSYRTTEFFADFGAVAAIVITALVVGGDANTADPFDAEQALRYITFLTIGYMLSRGLAKAGSRENSTGNRSAAPLSGDE